ncbi:MAG: D-alanine--D-alanine ligase [Candidatus Omnitrophica bacterium]|nr:D-alanine--D-alanine ligase [Candidatus Omnitrophota bacterium]
MIKKTDIIGILAGGPSNERAISLRSGEAVRKALNAEGYSTVFIDCVGDVKSKIRDAGISVAFIALHGRFGEDGTVQAICEEVEIPYTGSGVEASRLALDKIASKEAFEDKGILVAGYKICIDGQEADSSGLAFPVVVKPQFEGSSIGLSIVEEEKDFEDALKRAFEYGDKVIVEQYIKGREITVGILNEEPLPVIQVLPCGRKFYDYEAKYKSPDTEYIVPALIDGESYRCAQDTALKAHTSLGCQGFSRVDMIIRDDGKIFVLEVNTIPGLTARSLLPKAAKEAGYEFGELCVKLVELALKEERLSLSKEQS